MATHSKPATVTFDRLQAYIAMAFAKVGMPEADAHQVATLMASADLQGSDGHGVIRLPPYVKRIRAGGVNLRPNIRVVHERAGSALLDGDNGMGHLVVSRAVELAIDKARATGVGLGRCARQQPRRAGVAVRAHADRARHDRAVLRGGQRQPPAAVGRHRDAAVDQPDRRAASPRWHEPPVVLDMATTVAAYGKVKAKAQGAAR